MISKDFRQSTYYKNTLLPTSVDGTGESIPTDVQSIGQILAFANDKGDSPKMFWCKAKVVDVILTSGWFFIACTRCSNKMTKSGGKITCETCPTVQAVGVLRYRIEVIVEDDNDTSTFVIFEKAGEKLLKTTASDLAAKSAEAQNGDFGDRVPQAIHDIVGRVLFFYVKVSEYNFTAKYQSFPVYDVSLPTSVVTKKRSETCEPSSQNKSTKVTIGTASNAKVGMESECHESKKPRTNRRNKAQIILDELEE